MTKRHHYNRKGQPQKRCNPDTCPNCMYIGEGDSWCTNKRTCGAIVSFNNKDCDERGVSPVKYFNRRTEMKVLQSACGKEAKNESDS